MGQPQENYNANIMLQKEVYLMNRTAGTNQKNGRNISERTGEGRAGSKMNPSSYKEYSQVNYTRSS